MTSSEALIEARRLVAAGEKPADPSPLILKQTWAIVVEGYC